MKQNLNLRQVLTILFCSCFLITKGQNITIKSVALQPNDQTAKQYPCLDNNGDTCALLKLKTDRLEGIEFSNPNQYIKVDYRDGIYSVYVPTLSRKLDFQHKDFMPVQIDLADYGYRKLRAGKTYLITLDAHRLSELKSSVLIKVEPKSSKIIIDEQNYNANSNGTIEMPIASGRHHYTIVADNYTSQNGDFTIGKSEAKTLTIKLQPIIHEVLVGSNVGNARVFVDNLDYGGVGKLLIPQGNHTIRVQAEGYVDEEKEVSINSYTGSLSFILKENKRITHIHATPVTIRSSSSCIYKDNKKIKEWEDGATIMFMPGKYLLSDDRGNTKKIVVGSKPMEVKM
jgi:hypothetical protein